MTSPTITLGEPEFPHPLGQDQRRPPEGCDLYVYNFATSLETKVAGASTEASSEYLPTIAGDQIAFVRIYESRPGRRGQLPYLYVRDMDGSTSSRRLPGGARGLTGRPGPTSLDLDEGALAFAWGRLIDRERYRSTVRIDQTDGTGHRAVLFTTRSNRPGGLISPTFAADQLLAAEWDILSSRNNQLYLVDPDGRSVRFASVPPLLTAVAATQDGAGYFYAKASSLREDGRQSCDDGGCEIGRIDEISFDGFFAE